MMNRKNEATNYFYEGYNCSQSVVLAFKDLLPIDEKILLEMSSSFGGGISRLRETCGAVSGMAIVLGLLYGYSDPKSQEEKAKHYARVQEAILRFEEKNHSLVCRELLNIQDKHSTPTLEVRTKEYYDSRPCSKLISDAVEVLEEYIKKNTQDISNTIIIG